MGDSFIVVFWQKTFHYLRYISIFEYIRRIKAFRGSYMFVEIWVILNICLALISMIFVKYGNLSNILSGIILSYGCIRVFEITVYQVNVLLFDQFKNPTSYKLKSYRRMVILLLHNYLEIILWYAATYTILAFNFDLFEQKESLTSIFLFSFKTMVTFGADVDKLSNLGHFFVFTQAIIGLFMTLICLARFIGLLPKPDTMDADEKEKDYIKELVEEMKNLEKKLEKLNNKN